jgi:hypothetical protein
MTWQEAEDWAEGATIDELAAEVLAIPVERFRYGMNNKSQYACRELARRQQPRR